MTAAACVSKRAVHAKRTRRGLAVYGQPTFCRKRPSFVTENAEGAGDGARQTNGAGCYEQIEGGAALVVHGRHQRAQPSRPSRRTRGRRLAPKHRGGRRRTDKRGPVPSSVVSRRTVRRSATGLGPVCRQLFLQHVEKKTVSRCRHGRAPLPRSIAAQHRPATARPPGQYALRLALTRCISCMYVDTDSCSS